MGGTADSFAETDFRDHLRGALAWTTRLSRADCKATINANYTAERVTQPNQPGQNDQIGEPHGLVDRPRRPGALHRPRRRRLRRPVVTDWNNPDIGKGRARSMSTTPRPGRSPSPVRSPSSATRAAAMS